MRRAYLAFSWGLVALGVLHMAAGISRYEALTQSALWFLSGGVAIVLTGALNLLNRAYGRSAPGVRWVSVGANIVQSIFAAAAGIVGHARTVELVIIVGLLIGTTVLSALAPTTAVGAAGAA